MMTDAEVVEAARTAVRCVQNFDYEGASAFITDDVKAGDMYRLFCEAARMAAQPGIRALGAPSGLGLWMPDIRPDETPEQVFGLRFVAARMNGDKEMSVALFRAEWDSMYEGPADDPKTGRRFARSYSAVLALAAVYGERIA